MSVVSFLEKKWVIKFFGLALIISPFLNIIVHFFYIKYFNNLLIGQINILTFLKNGSLANYFLSVFSFIIGFIMLNGSTKVWKYTLLLVGSHMLVQIANYKSPVWQGPMAWVTFIFNLTVFLFIADQLVWKQKQSFKAKSTSDRKQQVDINDQHKIINLYSRKKILFSFGDKPWGKLKSFNQKEIVIDSFEQIPEYLFSRPIEINFIKGLKLDIIYDRMDKNLVYFKPVEMNHDKIIAINKWFREIAF